MLNRMITDNEAKIDVQYNSGVATDVERERVMALESMLRNGMEVERLAQEEGRMGLWTW